VTHGLSGGIPLEGAAVGEPPQLVDGELEEPAQIGRRGRATTGHAGRGVRDVGAERGDLPGDGVRVVGHAEGRGGTRMTAYVTSSYSSTVKSR
jgi:hypothetical protein